MRESLLPCRWRRSHRQEMNAMRKMRRVQGGRLIVFEGPDESGKTTVSKLLAEEIYRHGKKCLWLAFPGSEPGTLGAEIYALHHDSRFENVPPLSMQLLHVAAHIEALSRRILPALNEGTWVVLDRFWWSTWVYGLAAEADRQSLSTAIEIERKCWGAHQPTAAFLLNRDLPHRKIQPPYRSKLQRSYLRLALAQRRFHPVHIIDNNSAISDTLRRVVAKVIQLIPSTK